MKPVYKLFLISIIVYVIASTLTFAIRNGFRKYNTHINNQFTELFEKDTNFDILFLGSSRTHLSVNPEIIDSVSGFNSYNAGVNGGSMQEFYHILQAYLYRHPPPKAVFLNLDLFSFGKRSATFYFPVYTDYDDNPYIERLISDYGYNKYVYRSFPFLFLKDLDDNAKSYALKGYMGGTDIPKGEKEFKGYLTNSNETITAVAKKSKKSYQLDKVSQETLVKIIEICKEKNILLYFTYAPEYRHQLIATITNSVEILSYIRNTAWDNNIPFLRHDSLSLCNNPQWFANTTHLNRTGANVYSVILGTQIKSLIRSKG